MFLINLNDGAKVLAFFSVGLMVLTAIATVFGVILFPAMGLVGTSYVWVSYVISLAVVWAIVRIVRAPKGQRLRSSWPLLVVWSVGFIITIALSMPLHQQREARGEVARDLLYEGAWNDDTDFIWEPNYRTLFLVELWPDDIRQAAEIINLNIGGAGDVVATYVTRSQNLGFYERVKIRSTTTVSEDDPRYREDAAEVFLDSPWALLSACGKRRSDLSPNCSDMRNFERIHGIDIFAEMAAYVRGQGAPCEQLTACGQLAALTGVLVQSDGTLREAIFTPRGVIKPGGIVAG